VGGLALVLCCLATVYPAILAARMRPVEGLRYE
jgi:ABC-type lipoprotein release transport system permease subunit